jgi:hypothetical protein
LLYSPQWIQQDSAATALRDGIRDLGRSGLDAAPVRRDDRERRLLSTNEIAIVDAGSLVLLQRGEVVVGVCHGPLP